MNTINFSDTLSPVQHTEIKRWWLFTLGLMGITLCIITPITVHYALITRHLKKEKRVWQQKISPLQALLEQQASLQKEEQELLKHVAKLHTYGSSTHASATPLVHILQHMRAASAWLESLSLDKKSFELNFGCQNSAQALKFADLLNKEPLFENVSVAALQTRKHADSTQVLATIKGAVKKI